MLDRRELLTLGGRIATAAIVGQAMTTATSAHANPAQPSSTTFGLTRFLDPLPIPPTLRGTDLTVHAVSTRTRLHSQLPPTTVWAYQGSFPGPTIDVERGSELRVRWINDVDGGLPFHTVLTPLDAPGTAPERLSQNNPGYPKNPDGTPAGGTLMFDGVSELPPWLVTHLHGAQTNAGNDGWTHNAILRGGSQLCWYPNRQPATTLWYHDHAMSVTRWNVFAGLAGMYLIRDAEERGLDLPRGDREIPLVITERNLDTDQRGNLTGDLLYKIDYIAESTTPFFGPFTLVNGAIWPHLEVTSHQYRFRLLNAANARYYQLNLLDDEGVNHNDAVRQIGTDGGLLPAPVPLPPGGLPLIPGERADLLIDFRAPRLRGRNLRLVNSYWNAAIQPDVMQFRVAGQASATGAVFPPSLSRSYARVSAATLPTDHDEVWVALIPPGTGGNPDSQLWELAEITDPKEIPTKLPADGIIQLDDPDTHRLRTFRRAARRFDDMVGIVVDRGRWVVWKFINFGQPAHPMHVHATRFQLLSRQTFTSTFDTSAGGTSTPQSGWMDVAPQPNELGWKDMVNVDAAEWVAVAGQFEEVTGEFMYHCHILDHEDNAMMRPFVVQPPELTRVQMSRWSAGM